MLVLPFASQFVLWSDFSVSFSMFQFSLCLFGIILQPDDSVCEKVYFFFLASFRRSFSSRRRCRSVSDRYNLYPKNADEIRKKFKKKKKTFH